MDVLESSDRRSDGCEGCIGLIVYVFAGGSRSAILASWGSRAVGITINRRSIVKIMYLYGEITLARAAAYSKRCII
jgi:hypothetical protein